MNIEVHLLVIYIFLILFWRFVSSLK